MLLRTARPWHSVYHEKAFVGDKENNHLEGLGHEARVLEDSVITEDIREFDAVIFRDLSITTVLYLLE